MVRLLHSVLLSGLLFILGVGIASAQAPVANFSSNITSGCTPIVVQFTDLSTNTPTSWSWDLGNGTLSTLQNPSTTYVVAGIYTVVLTATNASGSNTKTSVAYITANPTPTVSFTGNDVTPACAPKAVQFINTSVPNSPGTTTYYWDFGDGSISTAQNPSHNYTVPGSYSVSLVVTNGAGCNQVLNKANYITVLPKPTAGFTATNNNSCTAPITATFTNTSTGGVTYSWDFGDGGTSTATSPTHTYSIPGSYIVRLIAINSGGCRDTLTQTAAVNIGNLTAGFAPSTTSACTGNGITFTNTSIPGAGNSTWYFGDGGTSTVASPTHSYSASGTYTVKLVVNYNNCSDSTTRTIIINQGPATQFSANPTASCTVPFTTTFSNTTTGAVSYLWLFGDGGTSTLANPNHTYASNGNYTVTLVTTSANGCKDTLKKVDYIKIAPLFVSPVGGTINLGCAPGNLNLVAGANLAIPVTYTWDFGDGNFGSGVNVTHVYPAAGNYNLVLTGTTASGCTNSWSGIVRVGTHTTPNFTAAPTPVCLNQPVTFTNTTVGTATYTWFFGDGGTSTATSPTYTYGAPGTFTPVLVTNNNGCTDTFRRSNYIVVNVPKAIPVAAASCANHHLVTYTNNSIGATTSFWDLGDGTTYSGTTPPPHNYPTPGIYTITLTVTNSSTGCTHTATTTINVYDAPAVFTATPTTSCVGTPITVTAQSTPATNYASWNINFGDGYVVNNSTSPVFTHAYTVPGNYTVTVQANDVLGCTDVLTKTNYIHITAPVAAFAANNTANCLGVPIIFTDLSTTTATSITNRTWDFGDGSSTTTTASTISHTYAAAGTYTVKLIVTDANGCKDSLTKTNYIIVNKPVSFFVATPTAGCIGSLISFVNASTSITSLSYQWDFGDGGTSTSIAPSHTYTVAGNYTVRLIGTDANGCKDTFTRNAYINISQVTAGFTTNDTLGFCPPYTSNFTNTSVGATSYQWDFGNGNTSTSANPNTVYTTAGIFTVTLKAFNASGCVDSIRRTVKVNPGPSGTLSYTPISGCLPITITFTATTVNTTSLVWDFNNGVTQTTTGNSTTYTYTQPGTFVPKLILSNANGCSTAIIGGDTIKINKVTAGFSVAPNPACVNAAVTFTDTSKTVTSPVITRSWSFGDATTGTGATTTHAYAAAGTYTVRLIATATGGCVDTAFRTITINPLPVITATDQAVCAGDSVQLLAGGAVTYSWSPATGLSCTNCANPYAKPTVNTTYTITGTGANSCTGTKAVTVTVNPLPPVSAGSAQTICQGTSANLQATGAATYVWSPATGLSCTACTNPVANPTTTTTYTVTGTSATGCKNTSSVTITVIPNPTLTVTPNQTICVGDSAILTVSGAASYTWSPATGLSSTTASTVTAKPTVTTTYTVLGNTITNGCQTAGSVTVTVNPLPTVSAGTSRAICLNDSTQLVGTGAVTYVWSPATGLSCTACANPYARPTTTTTYTVKGTSAAGCSNTATVTITINPIPVVNASASTAICEGASTTLTATGAATYVWTPATGLSNPNVANPTANPTVTTTYIVTGTSAAGCKDTAQVTITVNPKPTVSAGNNTSICPGLGGTILTATGAATYVWSPATGLSCTTCASPTANPAATTTYTVTGTSAAGCTNTATVTVTVNTTPVVTVAGNLTICAGDSTQLTASGANTFTWTPATGLSCANCANPFAKPAITTTYTVTGTSGIGCTGTTTVTVTVNPIPNVDAGNPQSICSGSSTSLLATGAVSYVWTPATGLSNPNIANPTANPTVTTTYIVTGTSAAGCKDTGKVIITVNPKPTVGAGSNVAICPGTGGATLTATGANTYVWSPATGLSCTACTSPVATPASTTTYTVTGTDVNGCTNTATVTVTVNTTPTITITGNNAFCAGDSTRLTAAGATTYSWSPTTGLSCTTCANPFAKPTATTTYTVTGTSGIGCTGTATFTVTVNPLPTVSAGPAQTICAGASANLAATGAATYVWTPAATLSNANIANPVATPTATTTYVVTGTSAAGCVRKDSVIITVNPKPTVATANIGICPGGSGNLLATGAASYVWSPATGLSCTACANPVASPAATTTYTVTGTGANGCTATATATVTVNPLPVVTVAGTRSICLGTSTTLTVSGAATYVWTPATGLSCTACASPIANPTITTTYTVTGTSGPGCTASTTVTITVNPLPTVTTGPAQTTCAGTAVTLTAAGASTYVWSPATGLSCTNCVSPAANPAATTTYTVTGTDVNGCTGTATVAVTVNPLPLVNAGRDTSICGLTSAQLNATGAVSYVWTPAATLSNATIANPVATPSATTSYIVVGTGANGCKKADTVMVSIYAQPPVNAGPDQTICAGETATLQASGAAAYVWSPAATLSCAACVTTTALPLVNTTYLVVGTDVHGCIDSDKVDITLINRGPVTVGPGGDICLGESVQLVATGGSSYEWIPAVGLNNASIENPIASPTATTTYHVVIKQGTCFSDTLSATVTVHPIPTVNAGPDQNLLAGTTLTINPTVTNVATYAWSPADGLSCITCPNPVAAPAKTTTYTVNVESDFGCKASDDITVFVTCDGKQLWLPNTFTPNADGQNDRFYPHGRGITTVKRFRIYDRWGELIYDITNMPVDDANYGWDGVYKNQPLKPDVYVYIVNAECTTGEPVEIKGDISLLR